MTGKKKRPAIVVSELLGDDVIVCPITSDLQSDLYSIDLSENDFVQGKLSQAKSRIRPNKLFTAEKTLILYKAGSLSKKKQAQIEDAIISIIKS